MNNYTSINSDNYEYPLEWLDLLVTKELNPTVNDAFAIEENEIPVLLQQLSQEEYKLQYLIKSQVFSLSTTSEIQLLVTRYYSSLIILMNQCLLNKKTTTLFKDRHYHDILDNVLSCLNGLFLFIENRFGKYLTLEERVPATYLDVSARELRKRLLVIGKKSDKAISARPVIQIVLNSLLRFTTTNKLSHDITFRDIYYVKTCVSKLEILNWQASDILTELNELLIYLNFNSKSYIKYTISTISGKISDSEDKLETLHMFYKTFRQHHHRQDLIFNPKFHDLETILENWFTEEITYYERKVPAPVALQESIRPLKKDLPKVVCDLSTDQIGLIIRSADELRILVARSMTEVFKTIVPYLSTPYKQDLSFDAVRSKSYIAEEKDKKVAIETLERMIRKIQGY